jgi:hypothetical protein
LNYSGLHVLNLVKVRNHVIIGYSDIVGNLDIIEYSAIVGNLDIIGYSSE